MAKSECQEMRGYGEDRRRSQTKEERIEKIALEHSIVLRNILFASVILKNDTANATYTYVKEE